jgi:hypothetical protein
MRPAGGMDMGTIDKTDLGDPERRTTELIENREP